MALPIVFVQHFIPLKFFPQGLPRKTWMEGVQAVMTTRDLGPDKWRNREEWHLVSGRQQQLLKIPDR